MEQTQTHDEPTEKRKRAAKKKNELPFLLQMLFLVALVFFLRTFVLGTVYVKGSSMEPNFHHGDLIFVNKLATSITSPKQGEIVICRLNTDGQKENIIKRVIGLPGDVIDIVWNGDSENVEYSLYVNDILLDEPYIKETMMNTGDLDYPYTVPEGSYFVMGDNRNASTDSRRASVGAIQKKDLAGKVIFRLYPFDGFGIIS